MGKLLGARDWLEDRFGVGVDLIQVISDRF